MELEKKGIVKLVKVKDEASKPMGKIGERTKKIRKGFEKLNESTKNFAENAKSRMGAFAASAKKAGIEGAKSLASMAMKSGIGEAMKLENAKANLLAVTRNAKKAGEVMKFSIGLANKSSFDTSEVTDMATRLEAMGISSKGCGSALADMAAKTNSSLSQVTDGMIAASAGDFEKLEEYGINKEKLIAAAKEKYGKNAIFDSQGRVKDQIKLQELLVSEINKRYKGGVDEQNNTLSGGYARLVGLTRTSLAKIIGIQADGTIRQGSMYEVLKEKIKLVTDTLARWQEDGTMEKISENVTAAFKTIWDTLSGIMDFISNNKELIAGLVLGFTAFAGVVKLINAVSTAMKAVTLVMGLFNITLSAGVLGAFIIGISALIAAIYLLWKNWDKVTAFFKESIQGVKDFFMKIVDGIKWIFEGYVNFFVGCINKIVDLINSIHFKIPEWVPEYGGQEFGLNVSKVPEFHFEDKEVTGSSAAVKEKAKADKLENVSQVSSLKDTSSSGVASSSRLKEITNLLRDLKTKKNPEMKININGSNLSAKEVADQLVPRIKLALANS